MPCQDGLFPEAAIANPLIQIGAQDPYENKPSKPAFRKGPKNAADKAFGSHSFIYGHSALESTAAACIVLDMAFNDREVLTTTRDKGVYQWPGCACRLAIPYVVCKPCNPPGSTHRMWNPRLAILLQGTK